MTEIKQYDKGFSPSALQRKYSLTYEQGAELADYIQGLKELLKESKIFITLYKDLYGNFPAKNIFADRVLDKIDEVLK